MKRLSLLLLALASIMAIYAETFVKITDLATLKDGDQVLMAYEEGNKASDSFHSNKKYIAATNATFTDDQLTITEPNAITIKQVGSYWNLYINNKPVGHKSGNSDLDASQKTTTNFAISIDNGNAKIISQTLGKNSNEVFFAYNASSARFALYHTNSNMKAISLYRLDESTIPDVVVSSVALSETALTLRVRETATLSATLLPDEAVDKTLQWGTTDPTVATVDNDGHITALSKGSAKIWAKATAVDLTDTCTLTVLGAIDHTTVTYNAVQDPAYLTDGAKVFFGTSKEDENYIMGIYDEAISKNNIKTVTATYDELRHTVTAEQAYAYTVQRDGDYIAFIDADGNYLRPISDSKLRSSDILDKQAQWTIDTINEDDATVELKNAYFTSRYIYNNYQSNNDLFNIYSGYDANYLAKTILYANTAPEWKERVLDSWINTSDTILDWGQIEPDTAYASDENWKDWGDVRRFTLTFNDLTDDITVTLTGHNSFYCGTQLIKTTAKQPVEISVYWETDEVGVYTAQLRLSTATKGVEDIVIQLQAEAVRMGTLPDPYQPNFSLSKRSITLNLSEENNHSDIQMLNFSASNLQKTLFCKWEHTSNILFSNEQENECMEILAGDYQLPLNSAVQFSADYEYTDEEILITVDKLYSAGTYSTKLHFYSYKPDSKIELAIDEYVNIKIIAAGKDTPEDNPDNTATDNITVDTPPTKVLHNGQLIILRDGQMFSVLGYRL